MESLSSEGIAPEFGESSDNWLAPAVIQAPQRTDQRTKRQGIDWLRLRHFHETTPTEFELCDGAEDLADYYEGEPFLKDPEDITHLLLYDGECGVCNNFVTWIIDVDTEKKFYFAPVDGPAAKRFYERHHVPDTLSSVIFIERKNGVERSYVYSNAVFKIYASLPTRWSYFHYCAIFPRLITDIGYRIFSSLRLRLAHYLKPGEAELYEYSRFLE